MNKRAQSTLEYAILIAILVAAVIGMQVYVKRSLQGRIRNATSQVAEIGYSPAATIGNAYTSTNTFEYTSSDSVSDTHKRTVTTSNVFVDVDKNEEVLSLAAEPARW
ncbi:MAG: hypothetical protein FJZ09_06670 [Candidatus Omnitrophica bacterium]|nr:hypothetical protein [Candidatus Omnitrophota bacterium]